MELFTLWWHHFDGLVQVRRNSIANALELHLSCTTPSTYTHSLQIALEIPMASILSLPISIDLRCRSTCGLGFATDSCLAIIYYPVSIGVKLDFIMIPLGFLTKKSPCQDLL